MTVHYFISGKHVTYDPETDSWTPYEETKPSWWTTDRIGIALYIWSILFALLVGYAWGAN